MKILTIVAFCILITTHVLGQSKQELFSLDLVFRPTVSKLVWQNELSPLLGYSAGFGLTINLDERNGLQTGMYFSKKGYSRKNEISFSDSAQQVLMDLNGYYPVSYKFVWKSYYLDVPVLYKRVLFIFSNTKVFLRCGVIINLLISDQDIFEQDMSIGFKETRTYTSSLFKTQVPEILKYSAYLAGGVSFIAFNKYQLNIEPNVEIMINPEPISHETESHLLTLGVTIGIRLF